MSSETGPGLQVLWATDGSEGARSAVPVLRQIVLPVTKRLVVLVVAPRPLLSSARPDPARLKLIKRDTRANLLAEAQALANEEARYLGAEAIQVDTIARLGSPIQEILREARRLRADLVVLGAKGHSNIGLLLLGSVSQGVVQHATQPILIARPGHENVRRIQLAYDATPPANQAATFLQKLALPSDAVISVARVVEPFIVPSSTPWAYRMRAFAAAEEINHRLHRAAERSLRDAATRLKASGRAIETEMLTGAPGEELLRVIKQNQVDLTVVGSRKPSALRHYLLGSTAEKLVRHADTSVLVVR